MSSLAAALIVAAFLAVSLTGSYLLVRRACRRESVRERLVRLGHERADHARDMDAAALDPGPVVQQATVVVNAYLRDHPGVADGFARLDQAACEHTDTTEGDQDA